MSPVLTPPQSESITLDGSPLPSVQRHSQQCPTAVVLDRILTCHLNSPIARGITPPSHRYAAAHGPLRASFPHFLQVDSEPPTGSFLHGKAAQCPTQRSLRPLPGISGPCLRLQGSPRVVDVRTGGR